MKHADFASAYGRTYDTQTVEGVLGSYYEPMADAIDWSSCFGETLYDHLKGERSALLTEEDLQTHASWVAHEGKAIEDMLSSEENHTDLEALQASTLYNFHPINVAMSRMWTPVIMGGWQSEKERQAAIRVSQVSLALEGLRLFQSKLRLIPQMQSRSENYFGKKYTEFRDRVEGGLNEIDTGITLLSIAARMPESSVVPGPLQFERSTRSHRTYNADYLWFDDDSVLGIQVKSQILSAEDVDYDESRIVLVDCAMDLANESRQRTDPLSSRRLRMPWGGLISAHHILGLRLTQDDEHGLASVGIRPHTIVQAKMEAGSAIAGMKSTNDQGVKIIRDRMERVLAQNKQRRESGHIPSRSARRTIPQARQAGQLALADSR